MIKVKVTYIGRRIDTKNSLCHFFLRHDTRKSFGMKKNFPLASIGDVHEITMTDEEAVHTRGENGPKFVEHDDSKVDEYIALDQVAAQVHGQKQAEKKFAKRKTEFDTAMEPLLKMFDSLNVGERQHFVNAVSTKFWARKR